MRTPTMPLPFCQSFGSAVISVPARRPAGKNQGLMSESSYGFTGPPQSMDSFAAQQTICVLNPSSYVLRIPDRSPL